MNLETMNPAAGDTADEVRKASRVARHSDHTTARKTGKVIRDPSDPCTRFGLWWPRASIVSVNPIQSMFDFCEGWLD